MTNQELIVVAEKLVELKTAKKALDDEVERLENLIKAEMNERKLSVLAIGDHVATWTPYESSRFDTKKFQTDHEKLYTAYLRVISSKRFSIE